MSVVNDKAYFFMIENQIRKKFPVYEVNSSYTVAEEVLKDSGITFDELKDYPVEGYYYKSQDLKDYFKIMRNLQENSAIRGRVDQDASSFKVLKKLTDSDLFGHVVSDKHRGESILPRRYDIVALTMRDESIFNLNSTRPWTLIEVIENLHKHASGNPNLVELAYLTKDRECLVSAVETNIMYRDVVRTKGISSPPDWQVNPEVEKMGAAVIEEYNRLFDLGLLIPTFKNKSALSSKPERPKIAAVGEVIQTKEWYSWRTNWKGDVSEHYTKELPTTELEIAKGRRGEGNIFNGNDEEEES